MAEFPTLCVRTRTWTKPITAALALAGGVLLGAADEPPVRPWADAESRAETPPPGAAVVRSRSVRLDPAALAGVGAGRRVVLDLFDDQSVTGIVSRRDETHRGRFTLSGHVDGEPGGTFVLAVNRGVVAGVVRVAGRGTYRLRFAAGGLHVLQQIDPSLLPVCTTADDAFLASRDAPAGGGGGAGGAGGGGSGLCDDGSFIDVLVVYTSAARVDAGGTAAMEAEIDMAIADNNLAYANSLVTPQMHMVFAWELTIADSEVTLGRLTNPNDGYMDGVHNLRDAYGADQVALIRTGGGGVANGLWNLDPESEALAFCVNGLNAVPVQVIAHEIGHNMGCCHALGDGGGCPAQGGLLFDYSNGHRFVGDSGTLWRTVMAYSPGSRIDHFSNPAVLFDGHATGVPEGGISARADNAQTINLSALTVSNWRCSDQVCEGLDLPSTGPDCDGNGVPDACDIALGASFDCNGNGVPDACDIASGESPDDNANGIPDECECPTDVNNDGAVNVLDLIDLLLCFGQPAVPGCESQDVNLDGSVNVLDLIDLLLAFGTVCP